MLPKGCYILLEGLYYTALEVYDIVQMSKTSSSYYVLKAIIDFIFIKEERISWYLKRSIG